MGRGDCVNPNCEKIVELLEQLMSSRLDSTAMSWVRERQNVIRSGDKKAFFLAFGMAPRKVGKADLELDSDALALAANVRPGWDARGWSVDQAARTLFVLSFPSTDPASYVDTLNQLFGTGEVGELVALYQALPLLPHPAAHVLRAAEGIRTNIKAVFCAVAHRNPYPAEQFSEDQWNQMVLKCQFIDVAMSPIVGLDQRANASLSKMVIDFIHERRAAKRTVAVDMWRCVGRYADASAVEELQNLLKSGSAVERQAAALALNDCPDPKAKQILATAPELSKQIADGTINWNSIDTTRSG
jgi:hypothetical protein